MEVTKNTDIIHIGFQGENNVRKVTFVEPVEWQKKIGLGTCVLSVRRAGEDIPYPVQLEIQADNSVVWNITSTDVEKIGRGEAQLQYMVNDKVVKTKVYSTWVDNSLGAEGEVPPPGQSWYKNIINTGSKVEAAVTHEPQIINGNWYVWSFEQEKYVDTGISAKGEKGEPGQQGSSGEKGKDGHTPVKGVDYNTEADKQEIIDAVKNGITIPTELKQLADDAEHRTVTDIEKDKWNKGGGAKDAAELPAVVPEGIQAEPNVQSVLEGLNRKSGGEKSLELLVSKKLTEPVANIVFTKSDDGITLSGRNLTEIIIKIDNKKNISGYFSVEINNSAVMYYAYMENRYSKIINHSILSGDYSLSELFNINTAVSDNHVARSDLEIKPFKGWPKKEIQQIRLTGAVTFSENAEITILGR